MSSSQTQTDIKRLSTETKASSDTTASFTRHIRSEITAFALIALLVFVVSFLLPVGYWLELALEHQTYHVDDMIVAFGVVSFVLMVFLFRGWRTMRQEALERATAARQLEEHAVVDAQLSQMTSLLHACFALDEANTIIAHFARQFFPDYAGILYVFRNSRNLLEEITKWGEQEDSESMFAPQQCWALRQGQVYKVSDPQKSILCPHVHNDRPYICLPMMAHGEVLALMYISPNQDIISDGISEEAHLSLLHIFTERIALALSNLKLRDTLRQQSIRDPLTGLFNRRYLEETLMTEIERARRYKRPFSIIMMDLDHFKRFNDTHGHEAGDIVLQTLGKFLQQHVRGGDIACRYGGEEFTLILPDTSLEIAQTRAEQLCEGIRTLSVEFKNQILGPLTLSVGVASFPDHGESGEMVLHAADTALYQAKSKGRDQVTVATQYADPTMEEPVILKP
ncbi:MAG TPA: GGDEF domain-containing protein [Anaerolineales bacterium]|nr:GGDEF domain-containing protein [Anaerolineales bacterium]